MPRDRRARGRRPMRLHVAGRRHLGLFGRQRLHDAESVAGTLDVEGHARLADRLEIPIAGGETLFGRDEFQRYLERDALDVVQPDITRVGGLTPWLKVAALVKVKAFQLEDALRPVPALLVISAGIQDPGNLGTIIRTADSAGCGGVILVGECCDPYSVEAVRATMGSIFAVPLVKASEAEFAAWRNGWPGSVVGALLSATVDYREAAYASPTLLLMGNEQQGLPPQMAELCDVNVKIPMRGRADSLNLSVAAGIMLVQNGFRVIQAMFSERGDKVRTLEACKPVRANLD